MLDALGDAHSRSRGDLLRTVSAYVELRRDRRLTAKWLHIDPTRSITGCNARALTGQNFDDPENLVTMVLVLHQDRRARHALKRPVRGRSSPGGA